MLNKFKTKILNHWLFSLVLTTIICFILDLVGYSCFNLYLKNVQKVDAFAIKYFIKTGVFVGYMIFSNMIIFLLATLFDKKIIKYSVLYSILLFAENTIIYSLGLNYLKFILDVIIMVIILFIYGALNKKKKSIVLLNGIFVMLIVSLYQSYILILRGINFININNFGFMSNALLYIDYSIVLISLYLYYNNRKEEKSWIGHQAEVHLFSDLWHGLVSLLVSLWESLSLNLSKLVRNVMLIGKKKKMPLKKKLEQEKQQNNLSKTEIVIFNILAFIFVVAYNLFTILVILGFAKLNNVVLEVLLSLIIFASNKKVLDKALHFKSNLVCFITSFGSYYIISRLTYQFSISIFIPALLGFILALVSSWYAWQMIAEVKRGMSEEEMRKIIDKYNLTELEGNLMIDYYCRRKSITYLANSYHYSEANIYKLKKNILDRINE